MATAVASGIAALYVFQFLHRIPLQKFCGPIYRLFKSFNSFTGFHIRIFPAVRFTSQSPFQFLHRIPLLASDGFKAYQLKNFQFLHRIPLEIDMPRIAYEAWAGFQFLHRIPRGESVDDEMIWITIFQFLHRIPLLGPRSPSPRPGPPFNSFTGFHNSDS